MRRYMRFVSLSDKSKSFIREKPLIPSSIIHNNKTITITLFVASRKRRSINTFQFVKPIQRCLINAGDVLLPIYIYIYIHRYRSLYSSIGSNSRKTDDESRSNWSNYIVHVCFSEYPRDKTDFSVTTGARMAPSNQHSWKLINLQVRAPSFVGW